MLRRIFVPLDGSSFSELALPTAAALARRTGATIDLVHVHVVGPHESLVDCAVSWECSAEADLVADDVGGGAQWLEQRAEALRMEAVVPVHTHAACGAVVEVLCEEIAGLRADLVIMATHARRGLERARLGSVADVIVRLAAAPVLLVQAGLARAGQQPLVQRILVVHDGSPFSQQIVPHARALACGTGARLILLRARSAQDILNRADRLEADVIALATHGRGGLTRLLLGSTADEIVRSTTRPVLLVRPRRGGRPLDAYARVGTELERV